MHQVSRTNEAFRIVIDFFRCLTTGLPRDSSIFEENQTFDPAAYRQYELARENLVQLFNEVASQYIRTPFVANRDEVK